MDSRLSQASSEAGLTRRKDQTMFTKTTTSRRRHVSSKDRHHDLPLCYFSLVAVVEPDANKWTEGGNIQDDKLEIWVNHCKKIKKELDSDLCYDQPELIDPYMLNKVIGIMNPGKDSSLPEILNEDVDVLFSKSRRGFSDDVMGYMQSIIQRYPKLRIAIVGGLIEDEIDRVTTHFSKLGPHPIILEKFCLSEADFTSLDHSPKS